MSSGSESDDDYVPGEPEQLSEEESADEETNVQYEKEFELNIKKRKHKTLEKGKKIKKTKITKQNTESEEKELPVPLDTEETKKREDDLWTKFLEGTDTKPKPFEASKESSCALLNMTEKRQPLDSSNIASNTNTNEKEDLKEKEKRIFEFAGETIVVENNVIKEKIKSSDGPSAVSKLEQPSRSRGAGLSNVLGQLNKKNKLSTLEKSKLDWDTYKKDKGIEEEIVSHNKGKAGFLERRDFLERTDVRQYEIERDLRLNKRSNR